MLFTGDKVIEFTEFAEFNKTSISLLAYFTELHIIALFVIINVTDFIEFNKTLYSFRVVFLLKYCFPFFFFSFFFCRIVTRVYNEKKLGEFTKLKYHFLILMDLLPFPFLFPPHK